MRGEWLRKPSSETSVIFVHGILSSGETAWRNSSTGSSWPRLLVDDTAADGYGVYVFTYQTDIFSGSYSLGDVVDAIKEHLRLDRVLESRRLIFVCHSMGGLAVRKYLVDRFADLTERGIAVGLYLVASPSLGSRYADWLEPLARLMGHAQADALRFVENNLWLADLDKNFKNLRDGGRLQIVGKELVEDKFVVLKRFLRTQVVAAFSGAVYFGEQFKVARSDHSSIAKPKDNTEIQHRLLIQFITDVIAKTPPPKPGTPEPPAPTAASLVQTPAGLQLLVSLASGSPVQIVQSARPRPSFDELFEVIAGGDDVPRALFGIGSRKTAALSPQDAEYVKEREGVPDVTDALQSALSGAGGRLLVLGRGGIGKTREVAELGRALANKRWTVCLARAGHHTRIGPVSELPAALVDARFLFVIDNVHASMLASAEDPTPYTARLDAFLNDIERLAPGDVSAIAIARDEPRFLQHLGLRPGDTRWGSFGHYRLAEFTLEGLQRILVSLARRAGVAVAAEDVPKLVENSDRKPETLFINVDVAAAARTALTSSSWLPTEGDSWRQKSAAASARFPLARHVFAALRMVTLAGISPRVEYVQAISRALSGEDGTRAIDGLVDEGLLRLRQNMLTAFSPEQLEGEAASERPLAQTLEIIAPVVIEQASARREWLDDLSYLAGAFGRADNSKEVDRVATLAIDAGLDTSRVYQLRGAARFLTGRLEGAVSDLSTAIARDERDPQNYVLRGNVRNLLGEFEGVIADMTKALELGRDEVAVRGTLGLAHARLQQWDAALASLTVAVQKGANAALAVFIGTIRQQTGDLLGAEADFSAVLEQGGLSMGPALDVLTAIGEGNASRAFDEFEAKLAAAGGVDNALVYGMRGFVRLMARKFAEADLDLTAALEGGFGASFLRMTKALEQTNLPGLRQPARELRGVIDIYSRDAVIYQARAAVRLELGRPDDALKDAQESLARGFTPKLAHWLQANIYNRMGRFAEAAAAATLAIDLGQTDAESYALRGFLRLNTNDLVGAEADLERAIELGRNDGWPFYWRALARQRQNNLKDAEADLGEAIQRGGVLALASFLRAGMRVDGGDAAGAEADAEAGIGASPADPTGFALRGAARINLGKSAEAEADLTRAMELKRKDFIVYRWRAVARMNLGKLAGSDADFSEALRLGDDDPQTLVSRAQVRVDLGRLEDAEKDLDTALAGGSTSPWIYRHRGRIRESLGRFDAAEQDLTAAIDGGIDDASVYIDRADCLRRQSKFAPALADYDAAIAKGRDDARLHFMRGLCRRELGAFREAERDLDDAIDRGPAQVVVLAERAFIRLQRGRFAPAESDANAGLQRAAEQDELRGLLFTVRGHSHYGRGDLKSALADFDAVLAATPDDSGIRVVRVACLLALGRTAEAEAELPIVEANPVSGAAEVVAGLLALMREDFVGALARFEQAREATGGKDWHSWSGLANLLLGRESAAESDYRRYREESPPGDCGIAVVDLDVWSRHFAAHLQSRAIQTTIANIRTQLLQRVADENAGEAN